MWHISKVVGNKEPKAKEMGSTWEMTLYLYHMKCSNFFSLILRFVSFYIWYGLLFAIGVVIATSAYAIAPFADATGLSQGGQTLLVPLTDDAQCVLSFDVCHLIPVGDAGHGAVDVDDERAEGVQLNGCA